MATLNSSMPTFLDIAKRTDPNGAIAHIAEILTPRNAFLEDAVWKEGNLPTGHKFTNRTGLPSVSRRRFNEGVANTKSKTDQVTETCTMIAGKSAVDVAEANLNGNGAAFRASEDKAFLQALNIEAETAFVYDSTAAAPEKMSGIIPRFDSTTGAGGQQIVVHDAAAAGADQTSMLLVGWGEESVFAMFPKGSKAGITHKDMGEQLVADASGNEFPAYVTWWEWLMGLVVKDSRFVSRIVNIDATNLVATGNLLIQSAIKAYHKIYDPKAVRLAWYCNRTIATYLHLQAVDSVKNSTLSIEKVGGTPVTHLLGIPVRVTDAITSTEAVVT